MTNHPTRAKRYLVTTTSWYNVGLGWERMGSEHDTAPAKLMTRTELTDYCAARPDVESTSITVYPDTDDADYAGDVLADCARGSKIVHWN